VYRVALLLALILASSSALAHFRTLPRHDLTPGVVRTLTAAQICKTKWGADTRGVTAKMKKDVMAAYKFSIKACPFTLASGERARRVEIDHLIPRSIGGADDVKNLWPQCYEPTNPDKSKQANGAHKKDRLETYLHRKVCEKRAAKLLKQYQTKIRRNWLSLYREIYGGH
jgi:hypothetical protein